MDVISTGILQIWNNPTYRLLALVIVFELLIIIAQTVWIFAKTIQFKILAYWTERISTELKEDLFSVLKGTFDQNQWIEKAKKYKESQLRNFLDPFLQNLPGDMKSQLVQIYKTLGFVKTDVKLLSSIFWYKRMTGIRRLFLVAEESEQPVILKLKQDRYCIRIIAASILTRIGVADDLFEILKTLQIPRRIMEQPLLNLLKRLPAYKFSQLMVHLEKFESETMQKILLIAYATIEPAACVPFLMKYQDHPAKEIRIGVCMAAGDIMTEAIVPILLKLRTDKELEVRAQAVKSLGRLKNPKVIDPLTEALTDSSFWVRQNAGAALTDLGYIGKQRLEETAASSKDLFAQNVAEQELRRLEMIQDDLE